MTTEPSAIVSTPVVVTIAVDWTAYPSHSALGGDLRDAVRASIDGKPLLAASSPVVYGVMRVLDAEWG